MSLGTQTHQSLALRHRNLGKEGRTSCFDDASCVSWLIQDHSLGLLSPLLPHQSLHLIRQPHHHTPRSHHSQGQPHPIWALQPFCETHMMNGHVYHIRYQSQRLVNEQMDLAPHLHHQSRYLHIHSPRRP